MDIDFAVARQRMVDNQIRTTDVTSHALLDSLLSVAREDFVPEDMKALAYIDKDIELTAGAGAAPRYLIDPSPLAKLLQEAGFTENDNVLDVGGGTGYVSAVISNIVSQVTCLEQDADLAASAKETLAAGGYDNVTVASGDLQVGHKAGAPYDAIFVNGSIEVEPESLFDQLAEGGRMIAVVGRGGAAQAFLFLKENNQVSSRKLFNSAIPALPGFECEAEFVF